MDRVYTKPKEIAMLETYFRANDNLFPLSRVASVDVSKLAEYKVSVRLDTGGNLTLSGPDAIELVLLMKPSAMEGRRLRWVRHVWTIHNLIGHPGMQILVWLGKPKWGIWLHEVTTPKPKI